MPIKTNNKKHGYTSSANPLHIFCLLFVLLFIVIVIVLFVFLVIGGLLAVILLFLLGILRLTQLFPLLGKSISLRNIIRDNHVVENGSSLNLPQIKADKTEVIKLVNGVIVHIFGIGDLLGLTDALVGWIRDALAVPITLVCSVVFHWRFPFAILFIVPIVWLLGIGVHDTFLFHPIIRLLVLWIINHGIICPILWLFVGWIRDLLWLQNLPILFNGSLINLFLINLDANRVVWLE